MKRKLFFLLMGSLIGIVFEWSLPFLASAVFAGDSSQISGEDTANQLLEIYFFLGGCLFMILSAWIGLVAANDWHKALKMTLGVVVCTLAVLAIAPHVKSTSVATHACLVIAWCTACALCAALFSKIPAVRKAV